MLQLVRHALATAVDVLSCKSNPILEGVYISLISLIAIFLGSKTSLKIWRALQEHDKLALGTALATIMDPDLGLNILKAPQADDNLPKWKMIAASIYDKAAVFQLIFIVPAIPLFSGIWICGLIIKNDVVIRIGTTCLTVVIAFLCLAKPLADCVAELNVTRGTGAKNNDYVVQYVPVHRKRAVFTTVTALSVAIYQAVSPSPHVFTAMMVGYIYQFVSRPSDFHNGRISIRYVITILGCIMTFMILFMTCLILVTVWKGSLDPPPTEAVLGMMKDDGARMQGSQLFNIGIHLLNGLAGTLIALVFRYEFSLADSPDQSSATGSTSSDAEPLLASEKKKEVSPKSHSVSFPSRRVIVTVSKFPKFRAPLFALCCGTLALVHVPALALIFGAEYYFSATFLNALNKGSLITMPFMVWAGTPPPIWGAIFVPLVVIIASYLREDGSQLLNYSEPWVVERAEALAKDIVKVLNLRDIKEEHRTGAAQTWGDDGVANTVAPLISDNTSTAKAGEIVDINA